MFLIFTTQLYSCLCNYNDLVSYCDKREVLQQEYSQHTILPSPHFRWVVNIKNNHLIWIVFFQTSGQIHPTSGKNIPCFYLAGMGPSYGLYLKPQLGACMFIGMYLPTASETDRDWRWTGRLLEEGECGGRLGIGEGAGGGGRGGGR